MEPWMKFSMPMFRDWIPEWLRPWIYTTLAFSFQLTCGIYVAALNPMMAERGWLREDVQMCLYCSLAGLAIWFPVLFRTKFRFHNRTLLITAALGIVACNVASTYEMSLPCLWIICFISGICKIQGTFECVSNVQLWWAPGRDFRRFFPKLCIVLMVAMPASDMIGVWWAYTYHWSGMPLCIAMLMLGWVLVLLMLTRPFRPTPKPFPLLGIDWMGAMMWSLTVLLFSWLMCYGEHYDWINSPTWCTVAWAFPVVLLLTIGRMLVVHHPYIEPRIFKSAAFWRIFWISVAVEAVLVAEHVLEEVAYEAMEWDPGMRNVMHWPLIAGAFAGCLLSLLWLYKLKHTRLGLTIIAIAAMAAYAILFYFTVSEDMAIDSLTLAVALRGFASAILNVVLLFALNAATPLMWFFQALGIFQCVHIVVAGVTGAAFWQHGVERLAAKRAALGDIPDLMSVVKQLFGTASYAALALLAILLVIHALRCYAGVFYPGRTVLGLPPQPEQHAVNQ